MRERTGRRRHRRRQGRLEGQLLLGGSGILLGLLVLGMGTPRDWWTHNRPLSFDTDSAAGLNPGMDVRLAGYPIGRVDQLHLMPNARIRVNLSVAADKLAMIGPRSRATLTQDGLLSRSYIAISPDPAGAGAGARRSPVERLTFTASPDLMSVVRDLAESRLTLQQMLSHTSRLVERRLPRSLDQLDRTLGSGTTLADTLRQDLVSNSAALRQRVDRTGDQVEHTLTELQTTLVEVQSLVRNSNALLREIRSSWLMHLLEPSPSEGKAPQTERP